VEFREIEESIKHLVSKIDKVEEDLIGIRTRMGLETYSLRDIAKGLGCSIYTLQSRPWKIPNYGKPDVDICPAKWFYDTVRNWYSIPENERRYKWESMTASERRKAIGKSDSGNTKKAPSNPIPEVKLKGEKSTLKAG